eukprot:1310590-Lingulodinium_polyedra.AAC.1
MEDLGDLEAFLGDIRRLPALGHQELGECIAFAQRVQARLRNRALHEGAQAYLGWVQEQLDEHHCRALYALTKDKPTPLESALPAGEQEAPGELLLHPQRLAERRRA